MSKNETSNPMLDHILASHIFRGLSLVQPWSLITGSVLTLLFVYAVSTVYDVFFGPLSKFPGSSLWAASYIPKSMMLFVGDQSAIHRLHKKYGPVVRITPTELSYTDPAAWKDIYGHRSGGKTKTFAKDKKFYMDDLSDVASIIIADDANHTRHRRILANSFSDKALQEQEPLLKKWASMMVTKLKEIEASGKPADMVSYYNFTTFDIMGDLTFAEPLHMLEGSEYAPWVKTIFDSLRIAGKIFAIRQLPFMPEILRTITPAWVKQKAKDHDKYSADRVDRRLARDPGRPDLWTEVLRRSGTDSGDSKMSVAEMHINASLFMTADMLEMLNKEVRAAFKGEDDITVEALVNLPYLNACLEEGLRMYPPVPNGLPRKIPEGGAKVAGAWIPGDTTVSVHHWSTYHSAANFHRPDEFLPQRWLGTDPQFANDNHAAFQPFSTGPRNCLGKNLAYHEARLLLTMTLWNFNLRLQDENQDWTDQRIFFLWEKPPLLVHLSSVR